jgi:hypothetical protein
MLKRLPSYLFLGACMLCVLPLAHAQSLPGRAERILRVGTEGWEATGLFLMQGGRYVPITAASRARGPELIVDGNNVQLFRLNSGGSTAPAYEPVGQWPWPEGAREAWLLLQAPHANDLRGLLMPDDVDLFKRQQVRVVNMTATRIALKLSDQTLTVDPFSFRQVTATPDSRRRVPYALALETAPGEWRITPGEKLFITPNYRANLLIYRTPTSKGFHESTPSGQAVTIMDFVPVNPPRKVGDSR